MKVKRLPNKEFKHIYSRVPRLCVDVVVKTKEGVVLSKRSIPPKLGWWHIPGGTVLLGESLVEAVSRVARDELGLKVKVEKLISVVEYLPGSGFGQSIGISFLTRKIGGKLRGSEQAREVKIFKKIPAKTIHEQRDFLIKHFEMR